MKDRIRQVMEDQQLTQQSFAQILGISPAQLSGIFNDRTKPTLNIVDAIHKKFPQVRLEWLLYGTLPMYENEGASEGADKSADGAAKSSQPGVEGLAFDFSDDGATDERNASTPPSGASARLSGASQSQPGSLFDQPQMHGVERTLKKGSQDNVKYIDKPQRKITEIRVFYDDQTWETFVPKK